MPKVLTDKVRRLRRAQQQGAFVRDAKDELASELTTTSNLHKKFIKQHEEGMWWKPGEEPEMPDWSTALGG